MPPSSSPGESDDWLLRARSNLVRAQQPKPDGVFWEDMCYDAQQAAEKAIKAVLISRNVAFRYAHDIAELLTTLKGAGVEVPENVLRSAELTDYAVAARYPGPSEPVTPEEFAEAVTLAEITVRRAESLLERDDRSS